MSGTPFERIPVAELLDVVPRAPEYAWQDMLPMGHVTLLGAHGGVGKSTLSLMLCLALAAEIPLFGIATRPGVRVALYSAEDGTRLLLHRLHHVSVAMGVDARALGDRLHVLDATIGEPALYREINAAGVRDGTTTPAYQLLAEYIEREAISVLVIDNASDVYDANENDRSRVRSFMRTLNELAQPQRAVLLLAHVDKASARGLTQRTESYSGSTAWHNSARSRLFLSRDADGSLQLEMQKNNLGRMRDPLRLVWPDGSPIPMLDAPVEPYVQHIADGNDTKALLRLIHEFTARGEYVAASQNSPSNAARALAGEKGYPKRKPNEVFGLLRDAERRGLIERLSYRGTDRKPRERWALTGQGCGLIGVPAPSAASAASAEQTAPGEPAAGAAVTAATCSPGGVGGRARTQQPAGVTAQ